MTLYRIINPLANPLTLNKYPVLYGHGVLYDSESMIARSENSKPRKPVLGQPTILENSPIDGSDDHSLPFMLSNNNFDVFLYDSRGTNNNNRNSSVELDPLKAHKFWDFSLDEQSLIDLPLLIDFVLLKTNSQKLVYVGYSQSTFFLFSLMATVPEYSNKVAAFVAMAPVCYVSHLRGLTLPLLAPVASLTPEFIHHSFIPQPIIDIVDSLLKYLCLHQNLSKLICGTITDGIGGYGVGQHKPEFYSKFFKSTSLKTIKHFLQLYIGQRYGMYDHGPFGNLKKYGRLEAPAYDLRKVRSDRILMFRGSSDFLSTPEDQQRLVKELGVKPHLDKVLAKYNHFDFIDGGNLIKDVNGPAILGIYELMYKDGPNLLRSPPQNMMQVPAQASAQSQTQYQSQRQYQPQYQPQPQPQSQPGPQSQSQSQTQSLLQPNNPLYFG